MIRLSLTPEEALVLKKALEVYLSDLRMEIAGTDMQEFRDPLKKDEEILKNLIQHLG